MAAIIRFADHVAMVIKMTEHEFDCMCRSFHRCGDTRSGHDNCVEAIRNYMDSNGRQPRYFPSLEAVASDLAGVTALSDFMYMDECGAPHIDIAFIIAPPRASGRDRPGCMVCCERAKFRCSCCERNLYCGSYCQLAQWRKHRRMCKIWAYIVADN